MSWLAILVFGLYSLLLLNHSLFFLGWPLIGLSLIIDVCGFLIVFFGFMLLFLRF